MQKIAYLVNSLGWHVINDYRFYHYGPYSDYLLSEIQNLEGEEIVIVEEQRTSGDNPVYFHTLTEKGHRLLDLLLKRIGQPKLIRQTKELIKELIEIPSDDLERMASLYYLHRRSPESSAEQLIGELSSRKPHFHFKQIRESSRIFDIMNKYKTA